VPSVIGLLQLGFGLQIGMSALSVDRRLGPLRVVGPPRSGAEWEYRPMSTQTIEANGITIAYEVFGRRSNPPVLLVMGLGTQMLAWPEEMCRSLAAEGYCVIRFDNRDAGLSTHLDELPSPDPVAVVSRRQRPPYRLDDMAADTLALIDALGLGRVHLVGASMGGFISQLVALRSPQRIASLTLIMTSTGSRRVGRASGRVVAAVLRRKPAINREQAIAASLGMFRLIRSRGFAFDEDAVREYAGESYDRGYDPAGGRRQLAAVIAQTNRTRRLRRLSIPTLVMHGLHDPLVGSSGGLALAKAVPGARFLGFHGMGHDLPRELWPDYVAAIAALARRAEPAPFGSAAPADPAAAPAEPADPAAPGAPREGN
jgi:pimeloyl-ACP methyl ester carboxylesterase